MIRSGKKKILWIVCGVLLSAFLLAGAQLRLVTDEFTVSSPSLPEGFDGFRIVQLSDLHGASFGKNNRRLLQKVEEAQPDMIALTGDILDDERGFEYTAGLIPELVSIAPCFYVTGNHEWAVGQVDRLKEIIRGGGATVLENSFLTLRRNGDSLILGGVEDPNSWADLMPPDEFVASVRAGHPDDYFILLGHRNYWIEEYPLLDVDVIFCGHSHGGVIRLPGIGGLIGNDRHLFPKYAEGAIDSPRYKMIVSRGLGNTPGTLRIFNPPEIVAVNLKKA